jgi:nitroreductase
MNELVQMVKSRRSVRQFENKPIPPGIIEDILDCARPAPTAINLQPGKRDVICAFGACRDSRSTHPLLRENFSH